MCLWRPLGAYGRVVVLALCTTVLIALGAGSAPAASYLEVGNFAGTGPGPGGSGPENGQLANPGQADVNDATGNLYVADTGNNRVEVFKATATAAEYDSQAAVTGPTGLAIDQSDGSVYVATATGIAKYDADLNPVASGWTDPGVTGALAVDPSTGDLLVADTGANLIRRFGSDGAADGTFAAQRPVDLAANSAGDVFVVTTEGDLANYPCGTASAVESFDGAGASKGELPGLSYPGAVAVDPDDDSLLVGTRVNEYFCEQNHPPELAFFDADGNSEGSLALPMSAYYAAVPALAAQGGGSNRAYAITKSPRNDPFGPTKGFVLEVPPPAPPQVLGQSAQRGAEDATLLGTVDPGGLPTEYRFEYGTTSAYGQQTPTQTVGGFGASPVKAELSGLLPGTTYHYHLVVESSLGEAVGVDRTFTTEALDAGGCPNQAFRAGAAAFLSDCRAYELVTPTDSDADIRVSGGPATPDGNTVCFNTEDPLADADPNGIKTADQGFCATRGTQGWRTTWVTGPAPAERLSSMGSDVYYLSPDGKRVVFASDAALFGQEAVPPSGSPYGSPPSAYMWEGGETTWLAPAGPPVGEPPEYRYEGKTRLPNDNEDGAPNYRRPVAVSADLTHGVFESDLPLVPEDENEVVDLYEWYPGGLRVVSTGPDGKAASGRAAFQETETVAPAGTMSADGSRIFFEHDGAPLAGDATEAPEGVDPEASGPGARIQSVYMREGDDITLISPRRGSGPNASVWFVGASSDGEVAYLETTQQLTSEAKAFGTAIYSYDVATDQLQLVADALAGVELLGSSADGSTILYAEKLSRQLLVERGGVATPLGTLATTDLDTKNRVGSPRLDQRALRITDDGHVVVFAAAGDFAGQPAGKIQIYRWEDGDGLGRVSGDGDAVPTANASIGAYPSATGDPREELFNQYRTQAADGRVISDDGSRVFFETTEALVKRDRNGLTDVYEWHDGTIGLVSTGTGGRAFYHESSADGKTVFFTTFDRLLPEWDRNSRRDLYVARPDGGMPPPPTPPDCQGEGCQAPRTAPPAGQTASDSGEGNVAETRGSASPLALGRKQLAQLASGGSAQLRIKVTGRGKVTATLSGKLGGHRQVVAKAARTAAKPGSITLRLKLSKPARKALASKGKLRLTLVVEHSGSSRTVKRELVLHV